MHKVGLESWGCHRSIGDQKYFFAIEGGLGTLISLDEATRKRDLGHFARVLVYVDLVSKLHDHILVERDGFAFLCQLNMKTYPLFVLIAK